MNKDNIPGMLIIAAGLLIAFTASPIGGTITVLFGLMCCGSNTTMRKR